MTGEVGFIYLIHFQRPYKHAGHYLGWATNVRARIKRHIALAPLRRGSALMRAVLEAEIPFKVVRLWKGTRDDERRFHNGGHRIRCPVCKGIAYEEFVCHLQRRRIWTRDSARDTIRPGPRAAAAPVGHSVEDN